MQAGHEFARCNRGVSGAGLSHLKPPQTAPRVDAVSSNRSGVRRGDYGSSRLVGRRGRNHRFCSLALRQAPAPLLLQFPLQNIQIQNTWVRGELQMRSMQAHELASDDSPDSRNRSSGTGGDGGDGGDIHHNDCPNLVVKSCYLYPAWNHRYFWECLWESYFKCYWTGYELINETNNDKLGSTRVMDDPRMT